MPWAAAARAIATSASGQPSAQEPIGATTMGAALPTPRMDVASDGRETSTSTRGSNPISSRSRRLRISVISSSAPPSMKSKTKRGKFRRASSRMSAMDNARSIAAVITRAWAGAPGRPSNCQTADRRTAARPLAQCGISTTPGRSSGTPGSWPTAPRTTRWRP